MRRILITEAKPDMIVASDIIDSMGRILLRKNTKLNSNLIYDLENNDIYVIYIDDELSKGIEINPPISPTLKASGITAVRNGDIDSCKAVAKKIVEEMMKSDNIIFDMEDLRCFDDYTFSHSVNVAVLACTLGMGIGLPDKDLETLVLAGLLHDMGKLQIPNEILMKPGRLTPEEFGLMRAHPQYSYDIIKDNIELSSMVKNAVLSHHENLDGSGYPNGLISESITMYAKILHIVDVYDALVSKRPYKEPFPPFAAIEILNGGKSTQFDSRLLTAFLKYVPLYPKASTVTINYDRDAIVVENSGKNNLRPVIRFMDGEEIDLSKPEYDNLKVTSPSEDDFILIQEAEYERKKMLQPIPRYKIMVLDSAGNTYLNLESKLSHLYDFVHAKNDNLAEGLIKKNGVPDLVIVDIDDRNMNDLDYQKQKNIEMSRLVPCMTIGSYRDVTTIKSLRKIGVMEYVLKPFHIIYMQNEINRIINNV